MSDDTLLDSIDVPTLVSGLDYEELFEGTSLEGSIEEGDNLGEVLGAEIGAFVGRRLGATLGAMAFESLLRDGDDRQASEAGSPSGDDGGASSEGNGPEEEAETGRDERGTGDESDPAADEQDTSAERTEGEDGDRDQDPGDSTGETGEERGPVSDIDSAEQLREMDYDDLQDVAKIVDVKANMSHDEMADAVIEELGLEDRAAG